MKTNALQKVGNGVTLEIRDESARADLPQEATLPVQQIRMVFPVAVDPHTPDVSLISREGYVLPDDIP
jgi:hypothetical protein